ncbi:hypothetical protein ABEB36_011334 [Hypothenemus hampei]|uniref:Uncharacterized protein n=1 Tax=Hypothenemus hampei TaxID=57062 RepID=A0ABD1EFD5_HYPHA
MYYIYLYIWQGEAARKDAAAAAVVVVAAVAETLLCQGGGRLTPCARLLMHQPTFILPLAVTAALAH